MAGTSIQTGFNRKTGGHEIIEELNRISEAAKSSDPNVRLSIEETQFMQITRTVAPEKGKWDRLGPEVK
jgi:hypothetical protein